MKVKLDKESLKKMFPNLANELQAGDNKVQVNSVRTCQGTDGEAASSKSFERYVPDVVDFIRRCDTNEQAEEIIDYMVKRSEIKAEYAQKLRKQLRKQGVRSFGSKKTQDYYIKHLR